MALLDCELLGRSVGLARSDVIFKSQTLDYITHTYDGEKKTQTTYTTTYRGLSFFCSFCDVGGPILHYSFQPLFTFDPRPRSTALDLSQMPI
jgi:hypothetical protein